MSSKNIKVIKADKPSQKKILRDRNDLLQLEVEELKRKLASATIGATTEVIDPVTGVTTGVTNPVTTGVTNPVTTGVTNPVTTGVTTGVTTEVIDPVTGVTTGVTTEVIDPVTGVTTEVIDPVTGVTTGVTNPVTTGVTTGVTNPVITGVTNPVITGVTNPVTTGVTNPVTTGVTTGAVNIGDLPIKFNAMQIFEDETKALPIMLVRVYSDIGRLVQKNHNTGEILGELKEKFDVISLDIERFANAHAKNHPKLIGDLRRINGFVEASKNPSFKHVEGKVDNVEEQIIDYIKRFNAEGPIKLKQISILPFLVALGKIVDAYYLGLYEDSVPGKFLHTAFAFVCRHYKEGYRLTLEWRPKSTVVEPKSTVVEPKSTVVEPKLPTVLTERYGVKPGTVIKFNDRIPSDMDPELVAELNAIRRQLIREGRAAEMMNHNLLESICENSTHIRNLQNDMNVIKMRVDKHEMQLSDHERKINMLMNHTGMNVGGELIDPILEGIEYDEFGEPVLY